MYIISNDTTKQSPSCILNVILVELIDISSSDQFSHRLGHNQKLLGHRPCYEKIRTVRSGMIDKELE